MKRQLEAKLQTSFEVVDVDGDHNAQYCTKTNFTPCQHQTTNSTNPNKDDRATKRRYA